MPDIERMTITLPVEMAATVKAAVSGGGYATASEIVREALRDWTRRYAEDQKSLAVLRQAIVEGDQGEAVPADQVFSELRAMIAERRAAKA